MAIRCRIQPLPRGHCQGVLSWQLRMVLVYVHIGPWFGTWNNFFHWTMFAINVSWMYKPLRSGLFLLPLKYVSILVPLSGFHGKNIVWCLQSVGTEYVMALIARPLLGGGAHECASFKTKQYSKWIDTKPKREWLEAPTFYVGMPHQMRTHEATASTRPPPPAPSLPRHL